MAADPGARARAHTHTAFYSATRMWGPQRVGPGAVVLGGPHEYSPSLYWKANLKQSGIWQGPRGLFSGEAPFPARHRVPCELKLRVHPSCSSPEDIFFLGRGSPQEPGLASLACRVFFILGGGGIICLSFSHAPFPYCPLPPTHTMGFLPALACAHCWAVLANG